MDRPGERDAGERPLLLVISTGPRDYREYLFASMSTRYRIHLINTVEPSWELPHLTGSSLVPSTDIEPVTRAAAEVAARQTVHGVLSWDEARVHQAALVAESLGLPTSPAEAVWRCRDKYRTRLALAAADLPQPAFALVGGAAAAAKEAARIGYPVIVKPRAAAASYGVSLVDGPEGMARCFAFADDATVPHMPDYDEGVLVEEFLTGPEISVDSVVHGGVARPLFVGHKHVGFAPYFEETGHVVSHRDPLLSDPAFVTLVEDAHRALGLTDGWTHAELKLTPEGPKFIEVNARLGGDLIPHLGMLASGIDPGLAAAAVACGHAPEIGADRDLVAGVRFCYVEHEDTVIESIAFDTAALPPEVCAAVPLAAPGAVVSPPPRGLVSGRVALVTAAAADAAACEAALDTAVAALRITEAGADGPR
jgi:biotin carboxylase